MPAGLRLADRPAVVDAWLPPGAGLECARRLSRGRLSASPDLVSSPSSLLAIALVGASPAKRTDGDPVSLIAAVYASYEKGEPKLYWDVFVDGQDWKLSALKITPVSQSATQADIRATFKNFGDPRDILISLLLEDGQWRTDEIQETLKPRWTMSKILLDAPDAFPDAPPDNVPDGN
jgi:hypothetical protein